MVGRVAGRVQHVEAELGALDGVALADRRGPTTTVPSLSRRLPYASTSAPVAFTSRAVPGEWSGCVWVSSTHRTRSRIDAPTMASM